MATRTKTFDCVEMKNRIQAEIMAEYMAHQHEFASFLDFVNARTKDSELLRIVREKAASTHRLA
jgi:hypothetical protein